MKINKILAAGVAATLAVTSLAAVASAETKSIDFDMETTLGKIVYKPTTKGEQNVTPGDRFKYREDANQGPATFTLAGCAETNFDTNGDTVNDYRDIDAFIPLMVTSTTANANDAGVALLDKLGTLTITVTGKKLGAIANTLEPEVQKIKLERRNAYEFTAGQGGAADTYDLVGNFILPIYVTDAPGDAFIPERFVSIDNIKVEASGAKDITFSGLEKTIYDKVNKLIKDNGERHLQVNAKNDNLDKYDYDAKAADHKQLFDLESAAGTITEANQAALDIALGAGSADACDFTWGNPLAGAAKQVYTVSEASAKVNGVWNIVGTVVAGAANNAAAAAAGQGTAAHGEYRGGDLLNEINILLAPTIDIEWKATDASTENHMAFVEKTTGEAVIERKDCWILSGTDAYQSKTQNATTHGEVKDTNQTYNDDNRMGTAPKYFGGLAGQCADFFNKQNNGKIIFQFTANATNDTWKTGGVPSTEVGLRNSLQGTAMALFFNYNQSTGSLYTIGEVDSEACTITFDISNILDDMGGLVKGNISDIYYGLNKGLSYNNATYGNRVGYIVEKVTLEYDDAPAAVDANTDDDAAADDDAAIVVADDDDEDDDADDDVIADDDDDIAEDDDIIEDDDDDDDDAGEIIEDDDDDDDDVNNDVDYVDADDDANPGTGVGLAVIPAIVAGAALVVSKKRK